MQIIKILYTLNLVFSYPLTIYPTNIIIDSILFSSLPESSNLRLFLENFSRTIVLLIAMLLALFFYNSLDKLMALSGTILGTTVVLFIPSLCHYKLIARKENQRENEEVGSGLLFSGSRSTNCIAKVCRFLR